MKLCIPEASLSAALAHYVEWTPNNTIVAAWKRASAPAVAIVTSVEAGTFTPTSAVEYLATASATLSATDPDTSYFPAANVDAGVDWEFQKGFPYTDEQRRRLRNLCATITEYRAILTICPDLMRYLPPSKQPDRAMLTEHRRIVADLDGSGLFQGRLTTQIRWQQGNTFKRHGSECNHCCCRPDCDYCDDLGGSWKECCRHCPACSTVSPGGLLTNPVVALPDECIFPFDNDVRGLRCYKPAGDLDTSTDDDDMSLETPWRLFSATTIV
jgi:hypothetical protein